ncbi:flagellar motor switch protein FliM [Alicyclobacillus tolerans]|uniref:flagellar motor switch protein FliM n=1 Tax=Alicyclobacillus tolerans TaxID=90970 RepID=UPI001F01EFA9|nr:flagellar motor switch protein FliM [Alicyclobacillus tolerans]MCF8564763.1 flagellar motor switch protein FliM [Alicyclobacillus tolerans]
MSDVLSQAEIDSLLSALTSGEVKAEDILVPTPVAKVRTYDFRRAMRFSKDHIRILSRIHEHFARLLTTHLSGQLRNVVQIQVESVDQVPYEEFIRSIPALTVVQLMEFSPLQGKVAVEINPQVVFAIIDRVMGGIIKGPYRERELTEIETALLGRVLSHMPRFFAEAWRNVGELRPQLLSIESNPQFLQLTTPNETVLVITLSAHVGNTSGLINVCIPHVTIEPLIPKLSSQYFMGVDTVTPTRKRDSERMTSHIGQAQVDVWVRLGEAETSVAEILELQLGDIIQLSAPIDQPVGVYVDNVLTYTGNVGVHGRHYAVKILDEWKGVVEHERGLQTDASGD